MANILLDATGSVGSTTSGGAFARNLTIGNNSNISKSKTKNSRATMKKCIWKVDLV